MPVLKRQKGQIGIGELEEKILNGTASQKEQEEFKRFEQAIQPFLNRFSKIESRWKNFENSPGVRIWKIKHHGDSTLIKELKWGRLFGKLNLSLRLEGEGYIVLENEALTEFAFIDIPNNLPVDKLPSFVYYKIANRFQERLRKNFEDRKYVSLTEDPERAKEYEINSYPAYFNYGNKEYVLIDQIAESLCCSSQTLRNWEKKGFIVFERIPYRSLIGKTQLRGIQMKNVPLFLSKLKEIKTNIHNPKIAKVPPGYFSTKEACKKLGICRRTLLRRQKANKIPKPIKRQGRSFYKIN
jgi:hypothetical protein